MAQDNYVNGHRPRGIDHLLHPTLRYAAPPANEELAFDLDLALRAVVGLSTEIDANAFTASILGTEREGNGIVIDANGLILTIGYLMIEASSATVFTADGVPVDAEAIGYDYETGFGLVRASRAIDVEPISFGTSHSLREGEPAIIAGYGGRKQSIGGRIAAKREFVGYWEYMLDEAIFTVPPHPNWGGTALLAYDGTLRGVGSLYVEDALRGEQAAPGNMFVPIDMLPPILDDLTSYGRVRRPPRPWLGLFVTDAMDHLFVAGVAAGAPAALAGLESGDVIVALDGAAVGGMAEFYRRLWATGSAGTVIQITVIREGEQRDLAIRTANRYDFLKPPRGH